MELFKNNIVKYEQDMGLSASDLAELAEMPISEVEAMERGKLTFLLSLGCVLNSNLIFSQCIPMEESSIFRHWISMIGALLP